MWKVIIANDSDDDFIKNLDKDPKAELIVQFKEVASVFDNMTNSVMCTSAIFPIESYHVDNKKLSIHYHIDNDEEIFRITSIEIS